MTLNFLRFSKLYFLISALFIIPGVYSLIRYGLKPGIDFTGGTLLEVSFTGPSVNETAIDQSLSPIIEVSSVQPTTDSFIVRSQAISPETHSQVLNQLGQDFGQVNEIRFESVGPILGKELIKKTYIAVAIATCLILAYVAFRFNSIKYGVSAVIAMLHDTIIVIGAYSIVGHLLGVETDTLFVTAVLTILSFSVHDTIVVYDRIREMLKIHSKANFTDIVNKAIAETMSRSINNSMTIIFMLLSLYLLGGETIKWFIFTLLVGTITGTYSSTFTAAPILNLWESLEHRKKR